MTKKVVHVTTLEQWKSVLYVWFKQGHLWRSGNKDYSEDTFYLGVRFLFLDEVITFGASNHGSEPSIEYSEFMAQNKEGNKMETYYVTKEQLDWINNIKEYPYRLTALASDLNVRRDFSSIEFDDIDEKDILRYLGGDTSVAFKVKEQLYRLWRIDDDGDKFYMRFGVAGTPTYTAYEDRAFTAPLEEIKKHKTISWEIERAE